MTIKIYSGYIGMLAEAGSKLRPKGVGLHLYGLSTCQPGKTIQYFKAIGMRDRYRYAIGKVYTNIHNLVEIGGKMTPSHGGEMSQFSYLCFSACILIQPTHLHAQWLKRRVTFSTRALFWGGGIGAFIFTPVRSPAKQNLKR